MVSRSQDNSDKRLSPAAEPARYSDDALSLTPKRGETAREALRRVARNLGRDAARDFLRTSESNDTAAPVPPTTGKPPLDTTEGGEPLLPDPPLSLREVAHWLGYHPATVRRLIRSGKLKATKVGGQWRINRNSLLEYMQMELSP
jgi:excisionase family DNA binding protein